MAPQLTLQRPVLPTRSVVGNDGLTNEERSEMAAIYLATTGSQVLHPEEREAIAAWRSARGAC